MAVKQREAGNRHHGSRGNRQRHSSVLSDFRKRVEAPRRILVKEEKAFLLKRHGKRMNAKAHHINQCTTKSVEEADITGITHIIKQSQNSRDIMVPYLSLSLNICIYMYKLDMHTICWIYSCTAKQAVRVPTNDSPERERQCLRR